MTVIIGPKVSSRAMRHWLLLPKDCGPDIKPTITCALRALEATGQQLQTILDPRSNIAPNGRILVSVGHQTARSLRIERIARE